ncbi:MAG: hypothetical protein AAF394_19095, partial [Planctomycetota bacterium]
DAAEAWIRDIAESLPSGASVLEIENTNHSIGEDLRRKLFLRPVVWSNVCRGGYVERPLLRRKILPDFESFLAEGEDIKAALQVPVFWIGGRSGDGKSVTLMLLCRAVKQTHPSRPVILFDTPDALFEWIETVALSRKLPTTAPLLLTVVDDLHKVTDWDRATELLERAAIQDARFAIVTCGPNPERALFAEELPLSSALALKKSDAPKLLIEDLEVLASHLGIEIEVGTDRAPTLVERIFLTLAGEASIDTFARSLKRRIDAKSHREELLSQLTAMAWLDMPLPHELVTFDESDWLKVLAGETQLHIMVGEDGFRFGHPAIARPIFEAVTRSGAQTPTLTTRIAKTLSSILNGLTSPLAITRILRQTIARLNRDPEIDVIAVLDHIFKEAAGPRVKASTAVFLILWLTMDKKEIREDMRQVCRVYRANYSLEPQTRAFLARSLAFAIGADEGDVRAATKLVDDPEVGRYMGLFLVGLSTRASYAKGLSSRSIRHAVSWVGRHQDLRVAQHVLTGFLARFPNDLRLRAATRDLI